MRSSVPSLNGVPSSSRPTGRPSGEKPADGSRESLKLEDFSLEPMVRWTSAASGASYPVQWRVTLPDKQIELEAKAALDNQEFQAAQSVGVTYWKGLIEVSGKRNGRPVGGKGFLEMTGYAKSVGKEEQ